MNFLLKYYVLCIVMFIIYADDVKREFTVYSEKDYQIHDFHFKFFGLVSSYPQGYYKINTGLEQGEKVISYIDENNDKFTDILTYKQNEDNITLFYLNYYNSTKGSFSKQQTPLFNITTPNIEITNVFGGSLFPNDTLTFIVTYFDSNNSTLNSIIFHKDISSHLYSPISFFSNTSIIIADIDGDRHLDIIYHNGEVRMVRHFTHNLNEIDIDFTSYLYDDSTLCGNNYMYVNTRFGMLGSAVIDIDGDCQNDLLITAINENGEYVLQMYRGRVIPEQGKRLYCLGSNSILKLNADYGSFTLGDFNNDGYVDIIFPYKSQCSIDIYYNANIMKYDWTKNYCDDHKPQTYLPNVFNEYNISTYTLQSNNDINCSFIYNNNIPSMSLLRIGDFKSDALPGIITSQIVNNNTKVVRLYSNDYKGYMNDQHIISWNISAEFNSCMNPLYASFFDFNEDGILDYIITCNDDNSIHAYFNHYHPDKYFIKSEMLLMENKYFSNEIGTGYRYIATNNDGTRRMDVTWQRAQNTEMIMNLPYALVGIGRSNNYIENFCVISNSVDYILNKKNSYKDDYHIFTPIIPKSQLLISKTLSSQKQIKWNIDLIVNPTDNMIVLMIVVAVILLLILIVIIILHVKELKEDKKQNGEKFSQWFA